MKVLKRLNPSQWIVMAVLALLLGGAAAVGTSFLISAYQLHDNIERLEPQIARLKGLLEAEQAIASAASASADQLSMLAYPASSKLGALGNNMQQAMRELFAQAGVTVAGSQVLPVLEQEYFNRVRIRLNATSNIDQLIELLVILADEKPVVVIDTVELKPKRRNKAGERELEVDMVLSSFVQI